jgi:hypothetical protein
VLSCVMQTLRLACSAAKEANPILIKKIYETRKTGSIGTNWPVSRIEMKRPNGSLRLALLR